MGVTLFYLTTFIVIACESDDLFCCRLLATPVFPRDLSKFSHKKNNFWWLLACYPLKGVTRSVPPHLPPLVTSLVKLSEFITNTKFDYELQNIIANHYVLAL